MCYFDTGLVPMFAIILTILWTHCYISFCSSLLVGISSMPYSTSILNTMSMMSLAYDPADIVSISDISCCFIGACRLLLSATTTCFCWVRNRCGWWSNPARIPPSAGRSTIQSSHAPTTPALPYCSNCTDNSSVCLPTSM